MKHTQRIKGYFNLIEVSLALGVTALGVAGVMTLLPYAIKSSQKATNDTYLASAASMVFAGIEQKIADIRRTNAGDKAAASAKFAALLYDSDTIADGILGDAKNITNIGDMSGVFDNINNDAAGEIEFKDDSGSGGKIINFRAPGAKVEQARFGIRVISTDVYIDKIAHTDAIRKYIGGEKRKEPQEILNLSTGKMETKIVDIPGALTARRYPSDKYKNEESDYNDKQRKYWRRVYVELSWPVQLNIDKRTKKYFVREYYFPDYVEE